VRICIFGLGSIGKRHAQVLQGLGGHEIFALRTAKGQEPVDLKVHELRNWKEVEAVKPEIALITNPTYLHIDTALRCAKLNCHLFIEKPIDSSVDKLALLMKEVKARKLTTYVAYNLRFHPAIEFLKKYLVAKKISHATIYNSSYFGRWRPNQHHLKSYASYRKKGGGVILELSHEFDYMEWLFGEMKAISGWFGKTSKVTVDSEDMMDALIKTPRALVNLHCDFLSQKAQRFLKIDCVDETIVADLIASRVEIEKNGKQKIKQFKTERNIAYIKQMKYFLNNIHNPKMMNNLFEASRLFTKIIEFREK